MLEQSRMRTILELDDQIPSWCTDVRQHHTADYASIHPDLNRKYEMSVNALEPSASKLCMAHDSYRGFHPERYRSGAQGCPSIASGL